MSVKNVPFIQLEIASYNSALNDISVHQVNPLLGAKTIMVQICDPAWTLRALIKACPLAVELNADMVLVNMLAVQHTSWLGTAWGMPEITKTERIAHAQYLALAASYGIPVTIQPFQYATLAGALLEAAEYIDAAIVFATLPVGVMPTFQRFQIQQLRRAMHRQNREFYPLP